MRYLGHLVAVAVICIIIISLRACCSAQTAEQHNGAVDWLSRYGYMPPLDLRRGALQTQEGIDRALRQMQRFAGIQETGRLDSATLALMKRPRCSLPDSPALEDLWRRRRRRKRKRRKRKRRAAVGLRWDKDDITWSVHSYPSLDRSSSLHQQTGLVELILTYALKLWSDVIPLDFHLLQDAAGAEGDIRVEFTSSYHNDGYPFDGAGGNLAHAFYPGTALMAGDTHFDDGESWSYGYGDEHGTTDLFTVAVHEFGHALGLSHSSSDVSIMKPYYQGSVGDIPSYTLPTDDKWAIQAVYGRRVKSYRPPTVAPTAPSLPNIPSPPPPPRSTSHPDPDRCTGRYDAVANIRGEVFFFKGAFFWRVQRSSLMSRSPALIHNFWLGLPATAVDAVYERTDGHIVFFIGGQYWMFKDTVALPGYPRPLDDWGMSTTRGRPLQRVEAAFVWTHNHKTYLFSEGHFWRFDESGPERRLEAGYPRAASLWTGVPSDPDDIISWGDDGNSYFFKDMSYWILKRGELDLNNLTPKSVAVDWMNCEVPEPRPTLMTKVPEHRGQECLCCDTSVAQTVQAAHWLVTLSVSFFLSWLSSLTFSKCS